MRSVIIGAGTYGEVYLDYLLNAGINIVGFIDDDESLQGKDINGVPVLGTSSGLKDLRDKMSVSAVYCPLGNNYVRVKLLKYARDLGFETPNFIHESVVIASSVKIGVGVYILPGSIIMPHTVIENDVMISMGAKIAHHSHLKSGTFISTGVNLGANIVLEINCFIGIGATIMTGVKKIDKNSIVGAGSVVIRDIPEKAIVAGNPAKVLRFKE